MSFKISFSSGEEFVQNLAKITKDIQRSLTELEHNVETHMEGWSGGTKNAYSVHKRQWDDAAGGMATNLAGGGQAMSRIVDIHHTNELHQTKRFNS
jgi:uncharacterized protein YukE